MKSLTTLFLTTLASVVSANAAITLSSTAPTVDGADIANTTWTTTNSDLYWTDRPNPGQTFTTGSNSPGYTLNSFSFQLDSSRAPASSTTLTYNFRIVTVSGTTTANVSVETGQTWNGVHNSGDWITMSFTSPVVLAANTEYGFDLEHVSGGAWQDGITSIRRNGNTFLGGGLYTRGDGTATTTKGSTNTNDRVFHADITAIPEPSVLGLLGLSGLFLMRRRR